MKSYQTLEKMNKRLSAFGHLSSITYWDEACMMPEGGAEARAEAMAELGVYMNEVITGDDYRELIKQAESEVSEMNDWQKANYQESKRAWLMANCLTSELVEESTKVFMKSEHAWRKYRADNNWNEYLPLFKQVVGVAKRIANAKADQLGVTPYDALIDSYEPGQSSDKIAKEFDALKAQLPQMINDTIEKQKALNISSPQGPFDVHKQKELGLEVMRAIGFDFKHGRLDVSSHPFCGGVPQDVRITTRYSEDEFIQSLMAIIHETGHARYEQNLPKDWLSQPVGVARGMGIHEGQSLLFELQVAHSDEFIHFVTPLIKNYFAGADANYDWSDANIKNLINRVEKSYIRVEADELTYPMHVILRFEIEKALFDGDLQVEDIPALWNEKMQSYLGISTEGNFKDGCLQDVHWPAGLFGYFPSYTLGAMNAAQLFATAKKQNPEILPEVKQGNFKPVNDWFRENIWSKGSLYSTDDLMKQATGETLNAEYFLQHLKTRYQE